MLVVTAPELVGFYISPAHELVYLVEENNGMIQFH